MQNNTNRNIWMLGWVSFFTDLASAMIKPMIPIYVVLVLHQGVDKLGIVVAVSTFISFFLRWLGGWLSDHFGRSKPFLILGYGLSSIMKPLIGLAGSWQIVAVFSGAERLGKALRSAAKDKLISLSSQNKKQGRAFGLHKTLDVSGEALGALVAFAMLFYLGQSELWIRTIFYWTLLPSSIAMLVLLFLVKDRTSRHSQAPISAGESHQTSQTNEPLNRLLKLKLLLFFAANFLMVSESFMLIRAHEAKILVMYLPLLAVAGTLTQAFLSYYVGKSADDRGDETVLLWGIASGLISLILLGLGTKLFVIMGFIFQGVFMVTTLNALRMRLGKFTYGKGKIYGWFYAINALVTASGALLMGGLWEKFGGTTTLNLFAGFYALCLLIYILLRKHYQQSTI
ncbi:MAG TPA: MFS transporter [Aeromonadales bacterium]|nr:MFS transporter [Aeromonadales bacterium]